MTEHDTPEKTYDLERLIFFSDGVFAIAITLLAIEIHPPEHWDGQLSSLFHETAAKFIFYFISFIAIGLYWMAHRFVFRHVTKFNDLSSFINILFLCLICLMPFVNTLTGEYGLKDSVFAVYVGLMGSLSLMLALLWGHVSMIARITDPRMSTGYKWISLLRVCLSPLIMGGGALWLGLRFGILPSVGFLIVAGLLSSRLRLKPFKEGPQSPQT